MSEQITSFLVDLVLSVLMFIIMRVIFRVAKIVWIKIRRTPKDPVIA